MSILIKNGWILTFDDDNNEYNNGYVLIVRDKISEIGNDVQRQNILEMSADTIIDAKGQIVMPGLINSHTHMFQTFMRGLADDKPLWNWLAEEIWPFSLQMTEEDFYLAALVGSIENLKCGATSVIDQHYVYTSKANADVVAQAMKLSGIRGTLCRCFANQNYLEQLTENDQEILSELQRVYDNWHGVDNGRITISVGPLNPWGCSSDLLVETKNFAKYNKLTFQIHTAETQKVVESTIHSHGRRNVEYFYDLGILDKDTQLVHAVWLDQHELKLIKDTGATIVHCPVANMYLASGVAPIPEMIKMGIDVCLGTDGPGSNNNQDMISVLKFTACLHKVHNLNSTIIYPVDILRMATSNAARIMSNPLIGSLKVGFKADVILVDYIKAHIAPVHNPLSALVYNCNGNDVNTVIVDGKVVVLEKKLLTIDENEVVQKSQQRILEIRKKLGKLN